MADVGRVVPHRQSSRWGRHWAMYRAGYLFVAPALILYAVFMIYPFIQSIYFAFTDWDGAQKDKNFVGLDNFRALFDDEVLWDSLQNTLIWVVIGTIGPIIVGLLLAMLLWRRPKGFTVFRTVYFMPQVLSSVVIAIVWGW